jgi:hypothetical protein
MFELMTRRNRQEFACPARTREQRNLLHTLALASGQPARARPAALHLPPPYQSTAAPPRAVPLCLLLPQMAISLSLPSPPRQTAARAVRDTAPDIII